MFVLYAVLFMILFGLGLLVRDLGYPFIGWLFIGSAMCAGYVFVVTLGV